MYKSTWGNRKERMQVGSYFFPADLKDPTTEDTSKSPFVITVPQLPDQETFDSLPFRLKYSGRYLLTSTYTMQHCVCSAVAKSSPSFFLFKPVQFSRKLKQQSKSDCASCTLKNSLIRGILREGERSGAHRKDWVSDVLILDPY